MECRTTSTRRNSAGVTLVEMLIATGLAGVLLAAVMSFSLYSARSFAAAGNYIDLDIKGRTALDWMSRDIRQCDYLSNYVANSSLVFRTTDPTTSNHFTLRYTYDPAAQTLTRTFGTTNTVLLTGCTFYHFDLYQRNPALTNGGELVALISTNQPSLVKAIDLSWICGRAVLGNTNNTEDVQSARVVIRKD